MYVAVGLQVFLYRGFVAFSEFEQVGLRRTAMAARFLNMA